MGLDTSHDCWHGPYSAFMSFRTAIARLVGIPNLREMEGFCDNGKPWTGFDENDPMFVFLTHSDCDGEIGCEHQLELADRLEALVTALRTTDAIEMVHKCYSFADRAQQFADGLRRAHALGEPVNFH